MTISVLKVNLCYLNNVKCIITYEWHKCECAILLNNAVLLANIHKEST